MNNSPPSNREIEGTKKSKKEKKEKKGKKDKKGKKENPPFPNSHQIGTSNLYGGG